MRSRFYAVIFVCFVLVIAGLAWPYEPPAAGDESLTPVVVELFTSRGCSSLLVVRSLSLSVNTLITGIVSDGVTRFHRRGLQHGNKPTQKPWILEMSTPQ